MASIKFIVISMIYIVMTSKAGAASQSPESSTLSQRSVLIAKANQAAKKEDPKKSAVTSKAKQRFITTEAQSGKKDRRRIDFDAVDISGERKTPLATMVNQGKANKDYDLIKIRLRWHPEMIESTSSLETGRIK